jgi:nanoRNase/pAp phosphatase (c-di-AMP/oligoRNAs hydrolase)
MKNYNVAEIKPFIESAKSALVVVPTISIDSIGAALALALTLKKAGKDVKVFCPQKTDQNYSKLSGLELLVDTYTNSDLIVSLDYPIDQIEAVSYNDDGGHLNLVVKTKSGAAKVETKQILINNNGGSADVCFMLGDEAPLAAAASMVNQSNWVLITPTQVTKTWAKATILDPDAPFSEIFTFLLPMLGLNLDVDSGKDLLIGLRVATQSFSVNVSPETFEAGAVCLRATQPDETLPQTTEPTSIENVEKTGGITSGTSQFNSTPTA